MTAARNIHDINRDDRAYREAPSSMDAEQALLGAILVNNEAMSAMPVDFDSAVFFEPLHRTIFDAAKALIEKGHLANPVTVKPYLAMNQMVGDLTMSQYLARLASEAVTIMNTPDYAAAVKATAFRRDLIDMGETLVNVGFGVAEEIALIEEVEACAARLQEIRQGLEGKEEQSGADAAEAYLTGLTEARQRGSGLGVPICLPELQTVLSETAFQPGRLYGMLSSSGEGKTSLTLQIIWEALRHGHPVVFLSYDQSKTECTAQMVAQNLGLEVRRQMNRQLGQDEIERAYAFARDLWAHPFEIVDCTNENAAKLSTYARAFLKRKANGKTPLIVIDHIGTIRPDDPRADEGTKARAIAQQLKALAKATGASVLVLQQRSSLGMKRPNPRPIGADLYGGEAAKQPFDAIFYLFRAQKYRDEQLKTAAGQKDIEAIEARFPLSVWEGKAELGAIKLRFGDPNIKRKVEFEARFTRYKSIRQIEEGLPL